MHFSKYDEEMNVILLKDFKTWMFQYEKGD
jgi:hypothetical protein